MPKIMQMIIKEETNGTDKNIKREVSDKETTNHTENVRRANNAL